MEVFHDLKTAAKNIRASAVALGNFDGCHLGHASLIGQMLASAKAANLTPVVLTFYPHPVEVLRPSTKLQRLSTTSEKLAQLQELGVKAVLVEPFTNELSELSPETFFDRFLLSGLRAKSVHVGFNFFFGKNRSGTRETLASLCEKNGMMLQVAPAIEVSGVQVSSSLVRKHLGEGELDQANQFLGRPYRLSGIVERGAGRGKELGFPTANIRYPKGKVLPRFGVYLTAALWQKQRYLSVTNVGQRPTFDEDGALPRVEAHLLNFGSQIYDEPMDLDFLAFLRDERAFESVEALKAQITSDLAQATHLWKETPYGK